MDMHERAVMDYNSNLAAGMERAQREGMEKGIFEIDDLSLMVDIIRYSVRGLEVPFIYGRIADGMPKGLIRGVVHKIIHRSLSKKFNI